MTNGGATAHLPLRGLRVLDLGDFIAAPYCARLLADAGADVLKVEPPGGDSARRAGPFPGDRPDPDGGALNAFVNRGKRSVTLDTATDAGRRTLGNLIERADVLVHDFASPAASPLGLDADAMLARYPRLVTASITPFGESGPYRDLRADDLVTMAMSGLAFATPGFPDYAVDPETEPPLRPNAYVAEFVGGLMGAVGATMALINRLTTRLGDYVEVSKQEAVACMLSWDQAMYSYGGNVVGRRQSSAGLGPNNYLPCADGWMVIVAFMDNHWRALVELMGNPEWAQEEMFANGRARGAAWDNLEPLLLSWLIEQPGLELFERAQRAGIPAAPALGIGRAFDNEQTRARDYFVPTGIPGDERGRLPGSVFVVNGVRRPVDTRVPPAGTTAIPADWLDG